MTSLENPGNLSWIAHICDTSGKFLGSKYVTLGCARYLMKIYEGKYFWQENICIIKISTNISLHIICEEIGIVSRAMPDSGD